MEYYSIKETAEKWGIDVSRVGRLARDRRIEGAKLVGHNWLIPSNAQKPDDERKKIRNNFSEKTDCKFRFPSFCFAEEDSFFPPLSDEEKILRRVELLMHECRFSDAQHVLGNLPETAKNRYCRIGALFSASLLAMLSANYYLMTEYQDKLHSELSSDFPYKCEMQTLEPLLESYMGISRYYIEDFNADVQYTYHSSAIPTVMILSAYSFFISDITSHSYSNCSLLEINCSILEQQKYYAQAQSMHIFLAYIYYSRGDIDSYILHTQKSLQIAYDYKMYFMPANYYVAFPNLFDSVLAEFPAEFIELIHACGNEIRLSSIKIAHTMKLSNIFLSLPKRYLPLVEYALRDTPNKIIASELNLSESTVNNRYSEIYDILSIKGKNELRKFFEVSVLDGGLKT